MNKDIESKLPKNFLDRIKKIFTDNEYIQYINSFLLAPYHGLNINQRKAKTLNTGIENIIITFNLEKIRENLYTYEDSQNNKPGKSIYYETGLYYIQEPSQMNAVLNLGIKESDKVLDLCASPGGKTIQALTDLDEEQGGMIISNEYDSKRAKILSQTIERMGFANCFVTNMSAEELSNRFENFFDKIILDVPCSGEGMFRKNPSAIDEWSLDNVKQCINRQKIIVDATYNMLKEGGRISYSTCTFETCENEEIVDYLLSKHSDLIKIKEERVYPFTKKEGVITGEGHYFCIIEKKCANLN